MSEDTTDRPARSHTAAASASPVTSSSRAVRNPNGVIRSLTADTTSSAKLERLCRWNASNASRAASAPSGSGGERA